MMQEIIEQFPDLRIAIGHFGMVTRENWLEQIKLARNKNVYIESGGITWLFNSEFYPYPSAINAINLFLNVNAKKNMKKFIIKKKKKKKSN